MLAVLKSTLSVMTKASVLLIALGKLTSSMVPDTLKILVMSTTPDVSVWMVPGVSTVRTGPVVRTVLRMPKTLWCSILELGVAVMERLVKGDTQDLLQTGRLKESEALTRSLVDPALPRWSGLSVQVKRGPVKIKAWDSMALEELESDGAGECLCLRCLEPVLKDLLEGLLDEA